MSDVFYPMGLISDLKVERFDRTILDAFEDGSSAANTIWGQYQFKRRFTVKHAPLSQAEFRYLRSFFGARSGKYDTFWFRDNVHRGGNAKVRLASPLPEARGASGYYTGIEVVLEEVAPIRILPEYEDVSKASDLEVFQGSLFHMWLDANREVEFTNSGDISQGIVLPYNYLKNFARNDSLFTAQNVTAEIETSNRSRYTALTQQYQDFASTYGSWFRTAANFQTAGSAKPDVTIFCIVKSASSPAQRVLFGAGTLGTGKAFGLQLDASNYYKPWIGGAEVWNTARFLNSAASTYRSVAITWASGTDSANLYVNGSLIGSESNTRAYQNGRFSLGAAPDGTLRVNDAANFNSQINHVMQWYNVLPIAQIKALHNLFAYQYGMAAV